MSTVVRFFQEGGPFMIPILLVFGFGIAIAIERWTFLTMSGASNRALWKKIVPFLKAGNFQEAAAHTSKSKAAIGSILTYGLHRVKSARRRDDIEKAMEESLMEVLPRLEKRTHYIATLANIATHLDRILENRSATESVRSRLRKIEDETVELKFYTELLRRYVDDCARDRASDEDEHLLTAEEGRLSTAIEEVERMMHDKNPPSTARPTAAIEP